MGEASALRHLVCGCATGVHAGSDDAAGRRGAAVVGERDGEAAAAPVAAPATLGTRADVPMVAGSGSGGASAVRTVTT